jgi:S1-C subfamily serine protease
VRVLSRLTITAGLLAMVMISNVRADDDDPRVRKSVVKITASIRSADYFRPWTKNSPQEVTGSGVVITGNRILTNAHVVNAASQIFVQPDKSSDKVRAKVLSIAPGIDLAVLELDDPAFNRKEALDATEEILSDNGIREQCSPDVAPSWNRGKTKKP